MVQNTGPHATKIKITALILLPLVVALHSYLIWLGGGWRIFALMEAGVGIFPGAGSA